MLNQKPGKLLQAICSNFHSKEEVQLEIPLHEIFLVSKKYWQIVKGILVFSSISVPGRKLKKSLKYTKAL